MSQPSLAGEGRAPDRRRSTVGKLRQRESAPDLEWPGVQNSYHAPGVPESAPNLTVPAPGQVWGAEREAGWVAQRRGPEAPPALGIRGCHRRPGTIRALMAVLATPLVPGDAFN